MDDLLSRNDLHEYQKYSAAFIVSHPAAALLLDCGLGKTVITLTALDELLFDRFDTHRVLVICPLRVGNVWKHEVKKWEHLNDLILSVAIGTEQERLEALQRQADQEPYEGQTEGKTNRGAYGNTEQQRPDGSVGGVQTA